MDQILANEVGQDTPLPSLELGLEGADTVNGVGTCDVGFSCAYQNRLAWAGPSTPLPVETNPRVVFDRLFGNVDSTDPAVRAARLRRQGSILDSVLEKVDRLQGGLGTRDRAKLDEYLQSVREIERRIQNAESQGRELPVVESPAGIPVSYDEHARLMFDMQALAFQTDTTRVITFQIGREQSGATYPQIGVSDSHHPISHHGGDRNKIESLAKINAYHASLFAYFLERLASMPDGDDGTVLDNVVTLYGSAISEGNSHDVRNLPLLLAGGGGGRIGERPPRQVPGRDPAPHQPAAHAAEHLRGAGGEVRRQHRRAAHRAVGAVADDRRLASNQGAAPRNGVDSRLAGGLQPEPRAVTFGSEHSGCGWWRADAAVPLRACLRWTRSTTGIAGESGQNQGTYPRPRACAQSALCGAGASVIRRNFRRSQVLRKPPYLITIGRGKRGSGAWRQRQRLGVDRIVRLDGEALDPDPEELGQSA